MEDLTSSSKTSQDGSDPLSFLFSGDEKSNSVQDEEEDNKLLVAACEKESKLLQAIDCHQRHLSLSDEGGHFVALSNLGLSHLLLYHIRKSIRALRARVQGGWERRREEEATSSFQDVETSLQYHQKALRSSISLQSVYGQALSLGNVGLISLFLLKEQERVGVQAEDQDQAQRDKEVIRNCLDQHTHLLSVLSLACMKNNTVFSLLVL